MLNYWIGIVGTPKSVKTFETRPWWCFPLSATRGDYIYMYCPRTASIKYQGIFALCKLKAPLDQNHENNYYCSGFGRNFGRGQPLFYGELNFLERYNLTLTAKEMKKDKILHQAYFVRRNFQSTIFKTDDVAFNRIKELLENKNS